MGDPEKTEKTDTVKDEDHEAGALSSYMAREPSLYFWGG